MPLTKIDDEQFWLLVQWGTAYFGSDMLFRVRQMVSNEQAAFLAHVKALEHFGIEHDLHR